jgi:hypothetical protein
MEMCKPLFGSKLVMEMCNPLFGSKSTVIMDNFYKSLAVLILLLNRKVFAQGTVRKNRCMIQQLIIYIKTEAEKAGWGALKWAVNLLAGVFAFLWTDGYPVHMLSTADGLDQLTTVSHQIEKDKSDVSAPKTVQAYNTYMQGIGHHDQLRAMFSLTKRNGFKKWDVKMWPALIDITLTNASICYFLANPELKKKEGHCCRFYAAITNFLVEQGDTFDWEEQFGSKDNDVGMFQPEYDSDDDGGGFGDGAMDDQLLRDLGVDRLIPGTDHGGPTIEHGTLCQPMHHSSLNCDANVKHRAKICQVCEYEECDGVKSSVNICLAHSAWLYTNTHTLLANAGLINIDDAEPVTDFTWVCPNSDWS